MSGPRYLANLLDTAGEYVDTLKFASGSFAVVPPTIVREMKMDMASNCRIVERRLRSSAQ